MSRSDMPGDDPFASVPDVDERLADWVDGTMNQRDRDRFEAEMRVSPHLREQVAVYEATVASIHEALNDETHDCNLADRVMASLAQEASGAGRSTRSRWPFVWAVMSAAALLGIAVLIDSWGGSMLTPKSATGTAAHLDSGREGPVGAGPADGENAAPANGEPVVGESANAAPEKNKTTDKPSAPNESGEARSEEGVASVGNAAPQTKPGKVADDRRSSKDKAPAVVLEGKVVEGKAGGGGTADQNPDPIEVLENSAVPDSSKLAKKSGSESDKAKAERTQLPLQEQLAPNERGRGGAPKSAAPRAAAPKSAAPSIGGPAGPGSPAPSVGGPATPRGPTTGRPSGPTTGGPAGPITGSRRARRGGRSPSTKPRVGAPAPTATAPPSPARTEFDKSAADTKRRKIVDRDGSNGRGLAQRPKNGKREYLVRLSEKKSVGEVLPLITVEGLAIASEQAKQAEKALVGVDQLRSPQTGSDDFYLGSARSAQQPDLNRFFDFQMRPGAAWNEAREEQGKKQASSLAALDVDKLSVGGLQMFPVGPVATFELKAKSRSRGRTESPAKKSATPGEWDANGGAQEQRDWLVVGPRSEVTKLLIALRGYSDAVETRQCRTGEVRLVSSESARADRSRPKGEPKPFTIPAGGGARANPGVRPATPAPTEGKPSPAAKAEPVQRVVIRFRVRR